MKNHTMLNIFKTICSFIVLLVALIPLWLWLYVKSELNPQGFWENFVVYGAGIWILGTLQVILLVVALIIIILIIVT